MQQITNLSDEADQITNIVLQDGSVAQFEFLYRPAIQRWMMNVSHPDLTVNLVNLCVGANVLRAWKNIIPFGLAVVSTDGQDPAFLEDFETDRITLFVLTAEDVQTIEETFYAPAGT